jgi:hypothetical protein
MSKAAMAMAIIMVGDGAVEAIITVGRVGDIITDRLFSWRTGAT